MKNKTKTWSVLVAAVGMIGLSVNAQPVAEGQNLGGLGSCVPMVTSKKLPTPSVVGPNEDNYNVQMWAISLPLRTNENWSAKAAPYMAQLLQNRNITNDVGYRLEPAHVAQMRPWRTNETLWFPARVSGKNGSKVGLNMLRYMQHSSDGADSLYNSYSLVGGNFENSPVAIGINWGSAGEWADRTNHTIIMSGQVNAVYDELLFIGLQSTYYGYDDQVGYNIISNYLDLRSLKLMTSLEVVGSGETVLATGARTLQRFGMPVTPTMAIQRIGGDVVVTFPTLETNRTATLKWTPAFLGTNTSWTPIATVNHGDVIMRPSGDGNGFFKLILQ